MGLYMALSFNWFGTSMCSLPTKSQVKEVISGCQAECDKKCVVDNHEVEIIHEGDAGQSARCSQGLCTPGRMSELCTPGGRAAMLPNGGREYSPNSARSMRSQFSIPRSISDAVAP